MNRSAWILALLAGIAWPVACGFPTVQSFASGGGGSGTGNGSSTSSNHGGSSSSSNPTSAGGGGMSSTMSNGGNPSGGGTTANGGANAGGSTASSTVGVSSTGSGMRCPSGDECDCDGDHHRKPHCGEGGAPNHDPADDCADYDSNAFPGQTKFFSDPVTPPFETGTLHNTYDYNCDGSNTPKYPDLVCGTLNVCNATAGWLGSSVPDCGDSAKLVTGCSGIGVNCTNATMKGDTPQSCQ